MNKRLCVHGFAARPASAEDWISAAEPSVPHASDAGSDCALPAVDITPALRGRIEIAAFRRGVTAADMLRVLFTDDFSSTDGEMP